MITSIEEKKFRTLSLWFSVIVVIIGLTVLFGWLFDIEVLKSLSPSWISMKTNTAICFLLGGISIYFQNSTGQVVKHSYKKIISVSSAGIFGFIALLNLFEYFFEINLGIDEIIFKDPNPFGILYHGRMARITIVCFLLLSLSNIFIDYKIFKYPGFQIPVLLTGIISLVGLAGYILGAEEMFSFEGFNTMAFLTVICFFLLAIASLFSRPKVGLMKLVTSATVGGKLIRKVLPIAVVLLFLLSWLHLQGELMGVYNSKFGIGILMMAFLIIFTTSLYTTASNLTKFEKELIGKKTELQNSLKEIFDYKYALDQSSIVSITDHEGNINFVNENFVKISKFSKEELIGKNHCILNSGEHPKEFFNTLWTNILAGNSWRNDVKNKAKDGTYYWADTTIIPFINKEGNPYQYVAIRNDITKRKNAEEALRKSEDDFKHFIHNSMLAIYFFNADTKKLIYANPAFFQLLGYLREEINSISIYDFIDHSKKEIDLTLREVIQNDQHNFGERVWKCKDGSLINMLINASAGSVDNEKILYISGQNITKLKQSEGEKEKLIKELSDKCNELMQFNYIVSHNLRAPIATLQGLSNFFTIPDQSEEDKLKAIKYIRQSVNKMDDLVKDLNVILSNRSAINTFKEKIFIPRIINNISDTLQKEMEETNCSVVTNFSEDASDFFTVKSYFESIFYNLISNAIKFHASNRKPQIIIFTKKVNNNLLISVSDNGIGIDMEYQGKSVFGLYKRFHPEVEGKGLGLHMTKTQVEALGGTIIIESEVNKGTTFKITLPYA